MNTDPIACGEYTLKPAGPGIIEVYKWDSWEPEPLAHYTITDGKCNCPHAFHRKVECKHLRMAEECGLLKGGHSNLKGGQ